MSLLSAYLNQIVSWEKATGETDDYSKPIRERAVNIKVRMQPNSRLVKDQQGKEVVTSFVIYTEESVGLDDLINGRPVIAVKAITTLNGSNEGVKVMI